MAQSSIKKSPKSIQYIRYIWPFSFKHPNITTKFPLRNSLKIDKFDCQKNRLRTIKTDDLYAQLYQQLFKWFSKAQGQIKKLIFFVCFLLLFFLFFSTNIMQQFHGFLHLFWSFIIISRKKRVRSLNDFCWFLTNIRPIRYISFAENNTSLACIVMVLFTSFIHWIIVFLFNIFVCIISLQYILHFKYSWEFMFECC